MSESNANGFTEHIRRRNRFIGKLNIDITALDLGIHYLIEMSHEIGYIDPDKEFKRYTHMLYILRCVMGSMYYLLSKIRELTYEIGCELELELLRSYTQGLVHNTGHLVESVKEVFMELEANDFRLVNVGTKAQIVDSA